MSQLAHSNLQAAPSTQEWYDRTARERSFQLGDQVLILLPTTANKLAAEWQGPYRIVKRVGEVDYVVHMHDRRKKNQLQLIIFVSCMPGVLRLSHGSNLYSKNSLLVCLFWQCFIYIVPKHVWFYFGHVVVSACLQLWCLHQFFAVTNSDRSIHPSIFYMGMAVHNLRFFPVDHMHSVYCMLCY